MSNQGGRITFLAPRNEEELWQVLNDVLHIMLAEIDFWRRMQYVAANVIRANRHMPLEQLVLLIRRRIIRRVPRYIYRTLLDIETAYDTSYAFTEFRPGA